MCKFFKKEIDFKEASNEVGWEAEDKHVCSLKKVICEKTGDCKEVFCQFAKEEKYQECTMYSA